MKGFVKRNWLMQLRRMNVKSYSLPSASLQEGQWCYESKSEGLRTGAPRAEEPCPSSSIQAKSEEFLLPLPFCSF